MPFWFALTIAVPPLIGLGLWIYVAMFHSASKRQARFERRLWDREELSEREFYQRFYAERGVPEQIPGLVRQVFANCFRYPAGKLRPDDVFYFLPEDSHQPCIEALERAFGVDLDDEALATMPCAIDPVVMYLNERLPTSAATTSPQ